MTIKTTRKPPAIPPALRRLCALAVLFFLIFACIFLIRCFPGKDSAFVDNVAGEIRQEMEDNRIVLSSGGLRRTVADFQEPILLAHGKEARLIVYSAELSEKVSLAHEGLWGFKWASTYQEVQYHGAAEYTVDLSRLTEADFLVNNEQKILSVRIPYATLSPITILEEKTQFYDPQRGWLGPKAVELTAEQHGAVITGLKEKMKARLIDENILAEANREAKTVVAELLRATVHSIDPEFTVVVVQ